jgi:hypothetical protein
MHKPLKAGFNEVLAAVGMGSGAGKRAAKELQAAPAKLPQQEPVELQARDAGTPPKKP